MKAFLFKLFVFGVLLFAVDRMVGYTLLYMSNHAKGGYTGHFHYLTERTNEDILILGSSRAIHHYNPNIIEDSLKMSCYNCGQEGSGIIQNYGFWRMIREHHKPKLIIYDVIDEYDLLTGVDNHKYLGWLKESYNKDGIPDIFRSVDRTEPIKMFSQMYRYNSKWHQVLGDFIYPVYSVQDKGYIPLEGNLDKMRVNYNYNIEDTYSFDQLKIGYFEKLIKEMDSTTKIVFVVSPSWYGINTEHFQPLEEMCYKYRIPFINYSNDTLFIHHDDYFKDGGHLNSLGADIFTKKFVKSFINK